MKTCRLKVEAQSGCIDERPKSADIAAKTPSVLSMRAGMALLMSDNHYK